jgi:hypothetical protein
VGLIVAIKLVEAYRVQGEIPEDGSSSILVITEMSAAYGAAVAGLLLGDKSRRAMLKVAIWISVLPLAINLGMLVVLPFTITGSLNVIYIVTAFFMPPIILLFAYIGLQLGWQDYLRKIQTEDAS